MKTSWHRLIKKGWWTEKRSIIDCLISPDGGVVRFNLEDVEELLNNEYPHNNKVWWFNETKDREIAERIRDSDGIEVVANPQVLWRHYLPT